MKRLGNKRLLIILGMMFMCFILLIVLFLSQQRQDISKKALDSDAESGYWEGYMIEGIYVSTNIYAKDAPCAGGHTCDGARFDISLNGVNLFTSDLDNSGRGSPPIGRTDGIGRDYYDRYSSTIITKEQAMQIDKNDKNKLSILLSPSAGNNSPHYGITWIRIKDPEGRVVYSTCLPSGELIPIVPTVYSTPVPTEVPKPTPVPIKWGQTCRYFIFDDGGVLPTTMPTVIPTTINTVAPTAVITVKPTDVVCVINETGDYNRDGETDGADYSHWRVEAVDGIKHNGKWEADFNCDELVDNIDYSNWRVKYLK